MKPFVGANLKMNGSVNFLSEFIPKMAEDQNIGSCDIVVAPPSIFLSKAQELAKENGGRVGISAQNIHESDAGAFTGEISSLMLNEFLIKWCIIGHSERRHVFGETDKAIASKVSNALNKNINVIYCIGELESERMQGRTNKVLAKQLASIKDAFAGKNPNTEIIIAYEPVWAIGTGKVASERDIEEAHEFIQSVFEKEHPNQPCPRIIYGGSVTGANSEAIAKIKNVSGFLVGGASLKPEFFDIVHNLVAAKLA